MTAQSTWLRKKMPTLDKTNPEFRDPVDQIRDRLLAKKFRKTVFFAAVGPLVLAWVIMAVSAISAVSGPAYALIALGLLLLALGVGAAVYA